MGSLLRLDSREGREGGVSGEGVSEKNGINLTRVSFSGELEREDCVLTQEKQCRMIQIDISSELQKIEIVFLKFKLEKLNALAWRDNKS